MARITEEASATVTMNMEPARKELDELKQSITKCRDKLAEMMAEPEQKRDLKGIKGLEAKIAQLEKQEKSATGKLQTFRDTLKNLNAASFNQLYKASKELESQIKRLTPGTKEYIAASHDLQMVRTRIADLRKGWAAVSDEQQRARFSMKGIADGFNRYFGMATTAIASITGLSMAFRKAAEEAAKLDDVYADVMKTTGLLHEEVQGLDEELMKMDTRTSREQLLLLARDAGKLGITGKENILGFVRAADQIQVALGEDLGEGAIKQLGKIADVYGLTGEMGIEKSLLSIASAVNALGQASTACEGYLVEFTQRLAGVGAMAGISVQDILGFASGLDQSSMKVEMAATAFQKFLMKMYEDTATFANYAGMEVEEFSELLKNDANAAITTVLKTLNGTGGFNDLVPMFDQMGLDGARAVQVLAAMAKNLEAVTDAQALANEEFEKATSVTEEYRTKNNNLQAQLEKARKEFHNASVALGQSLNPIMLKSTKATTHLIKALASYGKEIKAVLIALVAFTAAVKAKTVVTAGYNAVVKAGTVLQKTWQTILWASRTAFFKLIGATEAATIAQSQLNAVMSASVFGVIAMAIAGVVAAIVHYTKEANKANEVTEKMNEIQKRINSEYGEGAGKVQALTNIVHNNNLELDQRRRALDELKKIVPGYHADLTKEGQLINDNTDALKEYLKNLEKVTRQKILQEEYEKAVSEVMEAEKTLEDATKSKDEALVNAGGNTATIRTFTMQSSAGAYSTSEVTPYGKALKEETAAQEDLNQKKEIQLAIERRINNELGMKAGRLTEEEKAVKEINDKYKQLFNEAREMNRDNPAAANERIEQLKEEQRKEIDEIRKNHAERRTVESEETASTNAILTQTQFDYLQERQDKLTKKEKEMVAAGYAALTEEQSKALKARYDKLMNADNKAADQLYQAQVKQLEQNQRAEQNLINQQFFDKAITAEEHERQLRDITMKYLLEKRKLAEDNGKDLTAIDAAIISERMKIRKEDYDKELKELKEQQQKEEMELKTRYANGEITLKEYEEGLLEIKYDYINKRLVLAEKSGQDETAVMKEWLDLQVEAMNEAMKKMEKLQKEAKEVTDGLRSPSEVRNDEMKTEMEKLEELHNAKLLSEQQYEEAVKKLRKKYADEDMDERLKAVKKYAEIANRIVEGMSDFVTALKETETQKLEAEYQKQLAAAGDNAEERERIDAEYEQKKLDLQKKYADVDMAINIAKAIASGALAAVEAFAAAGGNPVLGAVFAALIAVTTAAEVASIIAQRNAIKNMSVSNSGSSSMQTGKRTINGYSEGGFTTRAANDNKPAGIVHANEWVAPAPMVRRNPVLFADLERYRKAGSLGRSGSIERGFAEGGFTGGSVSTNLASNTVNFSELESAVEAAINRSLANGYIRAFLVRQDLTDMDNQTKRFKSMTNRG